jgi:hypothetical protein
MEQRQYSASVAPQTVVRAGAASNRQGEMGVLPLTNALFVAFRAAVRARAQMAPSAHGGASQRASSKTATRR